MAALVHVVLRVLQGTWTQLWTDTGQAECFCGEWNCFVIKAGHIETKQRRSALVCGRFLMTSRGSVLTVSGIAEGRTAAAAEPDETEEYEDMGRI